MEKKTSAWGQVSGWMDHCFFNFFVLVAWLCSSCFECVLSLPWNCRWHQSAGRTSLIRVEWEWSSGIFQAHSNVQSGAMCSMSRLQPAQTPEMGCLHSKMNNSLTFLLLLMFLVPLFPISCWLLKVCWEGNLIIKPWRQTLSSVPPQNATFPRANQQTVGEFHHSQGAVQPLPAASL